MSVARFSLEKSFPLRNLSRSFRNKFPVRRIRRSITLSKITRICRALSRILTTFTCPFLVKRSILFWHLRQLTDASNSNIVLEYFSIIKNKSRKLYLEEKHIGGRNFGNLFKTPQVYHSLLDYFSILRLKKAICF